MAQVVKRKSLRLAAKGKRCGRRPRAGGAFCCKTGDFVVGRLRSQKFEQILAPPDAAAEIWGAPAAAAPTTGRFGQFQDVLWWQTYYNATP
jgi:hypothetical protein